MLRGVLQITCLVRRGAGVEVEAGIAHSRIRKGACDFLPRFLVLARLVFFLSGLEIWSLLVAFFLKKTFIFALCLFVSSAFIKAPCAGRRSQRSRGESQNQQCRHGLAQFRVDGTGGRLGAGGALAVRQEHLGQQRRDGQRERPLVSFVVIPDQARGALRLGQRGQTLFVKRLDGVCPAQGEVETA